jgi:hypothetical protein
MHGRPARCLKNRGPGPQRGLQCLVAAVRSCACAARPAALPSGRRSGQPFAPSLRRGAMRAWAEPRVPSRRGPPRGPRATRPSPSSRQAGPAPARDGRPPGGTDSIGTVSNAAARAGRARPRSVTVRAPPAEGLRRPPQCRPHFLSHRARERVAWQRHPGYAPGTRPCRPAASCEGPGRVVASSSVRRIGRGDEIYSLKTSTLQKSWPLLDMCAFFHNNCTPS